MATSVTPPRPDMTLDEGLTRLMQSRKIGIQRFRFPLKAEDAYRLLLASYAAEVRRRHREMQFTEHTLERLWQLAYLITLPAPRFGIMLCGNVGNGKTTCLQAFQSAVGFLSDKKLFRDIDGKIIERKIGIRTAKDLIQTAKLHWDDFVKVRDYALLAIDELGEEPLEVKDYGNIMSPIVDLIEHRYSRQLFTIVTTNLPPNKFESVYGARVADRFREMFAIINFGNEKSFRS